MTDTIQYMDRQALLYALEACALEPHKYRKCSTERLRQILRNREKALTATVTINRA